MLLFVIFVGTLTTLLVVAAPVQAQDFRSSPSFGGYAIRIENYTYTPPPTRGTTPGEGERATETLPMPPAPMHKVRVEFNGILVRNDHEADWDGIGDGEFDLAAYVQGKKVDLSATNPGLWDVGEGYLEFSPSTAIDVYIRDKVPLSIFTVGWEIDGCRDNVWPAEVTEVFPILYTPQDVSSWESSIEIVRQDVNDNSARPVPCAWPSSSYESDRLGFINAVFTSAYYQSRYPIGLRADLNDINDFRLDVVIIACVTDATCPPIPPAPQQAVVV